MPGLERDRIPFSRQREFLRLFEKDVEFFRLVFLLINQSCPIKKIDLVWAEDGPARRVGLGAPMGTAEALESGCAKRLGQPISHPDPVFCDLVNDHGRRQEISCGLSDKAAERHVRATRRTWVYTCHAGLVDIAVPVFCGDEHIATLLTGQVLREPPTAEKFVQIRKPLDHLDYIDWARLEHAYREVPVVSQAEIHRAVKILELFAEYLAVSWMRVQELVRDQERKTREELLLRREFAYLLLQGTAGQVDMRDLLKQLGFRRRPNRAFVIRPETDGQPGLDSPASRELALSQTLQQIANACLALPDACFATLRDQGVILFAGLDESGSGAQRARAFARRLAHDITETSELPVRVGIGQSKHRLADLPQSYREATEALARDPGPITEYVRRSVSSSRLAKRLDEICAGIESWRLAEAIAALHALPLPVSLDSSRQAAQLDQWRGMLESCVGRLGLSVSRLGVDGGAVEAIEARTAAALEAAQAPAALRQAFLSGAEELLGELKRLYAGKKEKLVDRAKQEIERGIRTAAGPEAVRIGAVAARLGVSAGHLSRSFRRIEGVTFERYLMVRRIEYAKQLLLDPFNNVSAVSELCGFSDPTYFSRVFRSLVGMPPSAYAQSPPLPRDLKSSPVLVARAS
jgi:AraC-like DNA-binding protein/ligand-binding sensor protein